MTRSTTNRCGRCIHYSVCKYRETLDTFLKQSDFILTNQSSTIDEPLQEFRSKLARWCYYYKD